MIAKTLQEYKNAKARLLVRISGRFEPSAKYRDAYNQLKGELKQCPADAKNK